MNYNDFQLLTDSEYLFLNSQYSTNKTKFQQQNLIENICNNLSEIISSCNTHNLRLNIKTINAIEQTRQQANLMINNLINTFSISPRTKYIEQNFNIFEVCEHLVELINLHQKWIEIEEKEFYKNIAIKNIQNLIFELKNIFSALKESFILFFKHM